MAGSKPAPGASDEDLCSSPKPRGDITGDLGGTWQATGYGNFHRP